jgi:hypothetical protein
MAMQKQSLPHWHSEKQFPHWHREKQFHWCVRGVNASSPSSHPNDPIYPIKFLNLHKSHLPFILILIKSYLQFHKYALFS